MVPPYLRRRLLTICWMYNNFGWFLNGLVSHRVHGISLLQLFSISSKWIAVHHWGEPPAFLRIWIYPPGSWHDDNPTTPFFKFRWLLSKRGKHRCLPLEQRMTYNNYGQKPVVTASSHKVLSWVIPAAKAETGDILRATLMVRIHSCLLNRCLRFARS